MVNRSWTSLVGKKPRVLEANWRKVDKHGHWTSPSDEEVIFPRLS